MNEYNQVVSDAMHELRYFNQRLKNLMVEVSKKVGTGKINKKEPLNMHYQNADELRLLAESILEISMLFTSRLDFIECELNPDAINDLPVSDFNMFGKFDKAKRILNAFSRGKKVKVAISNGSSSTAVTRTVKARSIIDILPYLILDNAIKYSPNESDVYIDYVEYDNSVVIKVESVGPFVSQEEIAHVFDKGYRSSNAKGNKETTGKGLGLYFAKYICEINNIEIKVFSEKLNYQLSGIDMSNFRVEMSFLLN
ncbi:ATP-binding protein [Pectobacterium parmentieri]|uniref:sensor histidine kinase n=1 Tax=Pectobacterium parmentieri TaxID=1905730 RepID=UPI0030175992